MTCGVTGGTCQKAKVEKWNVSNYFSCLYCEADIAI